MPTPERAPNGNWQVSDPADRELAARVKAGDTALLTFDGIPGLEITGKVVSVSAYGQNRLGETVYTVTIALEKTTPACVGT